MTCNRSTQKHQSTMATCLFNGTLHLLSSSPTTTTLQFSPMTTPPIPYVLGSFTSIFSPGQSPSLPLMYWVHSPQYFLLDSHRHYPLCTGFIHLNTFSWTVTVTTPYVLGSFTSIFSPGQSPSLPLMYWVHSPPQYFLLDSHRHYPLCTGFIHLNTFSWTVTVTTPYVLGSFTSIFSPGQSPSLPLMYWVHSPQYFLLDSHRHYPLCTGFIHLHIFSWTVTVTTPYVLGSFTTSIFSPGQSPSLPLMYWVHSPQYFLLIM